MDATENTRGRKIMETKEHNRREGYFEMYGAARSNRNEKERDLLLKVMEETPHPDRNPKGLGRPTVHSKSKMDFLCVYMLSLNSTYDDAVDDLNKMKHIWNEPIPGASWASKHMKTLDEKWLKTIQRKIAALCLDEIKNVDAPVGIDSTGVEEDKYEYAEDYDPNDPDLEAHKYKVYSKWHTVVILGYQIIIAAVHTTNKVSDTEMMIPLLKDVEEAKIVLAGRYFDADAAYDAKKNLKS